MTETNLPGGDGRADAPLVLDAGLTVAEAAAVASGVRQIDIAQAAWARVAAGHARLQDCIRDRRLVYGLTTGFGPLADRLIAPQDARLLQENLVNHLATGVGRPLRWAEARAVALARLLSLLQGVSGASPAAVDLLAALVRSDLAPLIPEKGTVGASGDLTPLAHMTLALMGCGAFIDRDGHRVAPDAALRRLGRPPLDLAARDGLALVNGTSAMTGIAVLSGAAAARAFAWSFALTAATAELLGGRAEAWAPAFAAVRRHPGQARAAQALAARIAGSGLIEHGAVSARRLGSGEPPRQSRPAQDAYTLRCAPQILGACLDALAWHDRVVETELGSATDNPIFPEDGAPALHGGNFMGQHVAFAADALSNAVIVAGGLAERQIARLTDERLNGGLPAFLHRGAPGLNSGLMGAQVTATALHAEMRSRAVPASIQSISTNGANQDVVSMGTIAARRACEHLTELARIQAILALAVAQGLDLLDIRGTGQRASAGWRGLHAAVRRVSPPIERDRPLGSEIEALAATLAAADPPPLAPIREQGGMG